MNILGHAYIAVSAVSGDRRLLIIGSLLPESFPFIPGNPFNNEEIHEGGEKLLQFLNQNHPQKRDLALGVLAHSRQFGADGFHKKLEEYIGDQKDSFLQEIAQASGLDISIAPNRLHNFLSWGLDLLILRNKPKFVEEVDQALKQVDIEEISRLLSECFKKDYQETLRIFKILFKKIYRSEDLYSAKGLASIWARQAAGLPEHDIIDIEKATKIIEKSADLFKNDYEEFLELVINAVRVNLRKYGNRK